MWLKCSKKWMDWLEKGRLGIRGRKGSSKPHFFSAWIEKWLFSLVMQSCDYKLWWNVFGELNV